MDTIHDQELKKKESEPTLARPSRDSITESSKGDGYFANGLWIEMAPDLRDLPEIDYNDPNVQKWIEETEADWKNRNPTLNHQELIRSVEEKILRKKSPSA